MASNSHDAGHGAADAAHGAADAAHHAADAAHGSGGMPQLDTTSYPSQIFWLAVSFAILFLVM